ncbi:MAG: hypothetical protein K2X47_11420 [Bdellovibrionales bacterium]|nr:hypothetical protein [Bdellovibrionales bacterium]
MRRRSVSTLLTVLLIYGSALLGPGVVLGDALTLSAGAFSLSAQVQGRQVKIAGPGSYAITWFRPLFHRIDVMIGYSLIMTSVIGGDLGYGPDIGFALYPLSRAENLDSRSENTSLRIEEIWRPFVSGQFIQRQFQSTQSNYSGFQLSAGTFYRWNEDISLYGQFRYGMLLGPSEATATETNLLLGFSLGL